MSNRSSAGETRTIHPCALAELGEEACIVALGVARDLRSGVIPPERYSQEEYCGMACCIAGHIALRLGEDVMQFVNRRSIINSDSLRWDSTSLFGNSQAELPDVAADAIERYVYDGSETPWSTS